MVQHSYPVPPQHMGGPVGGGSKSGQGVRHQLQGLPIAQAAGSQSNVSSHHWVLDIMSYVLCFPQICQQFNTSVAHVCEWGSEVSIIHNEQRINA